MLTRKSLIDHVMLLNGDSSISVELNDEDFDNCIIPIMLDVYNKYQPIIKEIDLLVSPNVQDYKLNKLDVGRGVWDVYPSTDLVNSSVNSNLIFSRDYFPVNHGNTMDLLDPTSLLLQSINNDNISQVSGSKFEYDYHHDFGVLRFYETPNVRSKFKVYTCHDRKFTSTNVSSASITNNTVEIPLIDNDGFPVHYNSPNFFITIGNVKFKSISRTELISTSKNTGTYDYETSTLILNLPSTVEVSEGKVHDIKIDASELRSEDEGWLKSYATCIGDTILGRKRKRFSTIPGAQERIDLYVDILQEGSEARLALEDTAQSWIYNWAIPRTL